jgi:RiboL-PSP-HEPN
MASASLLAFRKGILEVDQLQHADPTPLGTPPTKPEITRVIGRASVVLLSSHFERYIYAINEEATQLLNDEEVAGDLLPETVRLLHSSEPIDVLLGTSWERRAEQLAEFIEREGWLWRSGSKGVLDHNRLIVWMKAPSPRYLVRYFRCWGIENIFFAIARTPHTRSELQLRIEELVQKRNNIAHGDLSIEATHTDVALYREVTTTFSERADRILGKSIGKLVGRRSAW